MNLTLSEVEEQTFKFCGVSKESISESYVTEDLISGF